MKTSAARFAVLLSLSAGCSAGTVGAGGGGQGGGEGDEGGAGDAIVPPGACRVSDAALPLSRAWRLSPLQYANTLRADFGFEADVRALPIEIPQGEGYAVFSTGSQGKGVSSEYFGPFRDNAVRLAERLLGEVERDRGCVLGEGDPGCLHDFVNAYGERAFRRPLFAEERERYVAFFRDARTRWDARAAARLVLEAMLQSPNHLYRTELGSGEGPIVRLTHHEVAQQLAYTLTDGPPDGELAAAAREGRLHDPDEVRRQAERLLTSPGARAKLGQFFSEYLRGYEIEAGNLGKDTQVFPQFTPAVRAAMATESKTFVDRVLFEEHGDLRTLYGADFSFVNRELAGIYGVSVAGSGFERVTLPGERRGLLSQPGFLAVTSPADHTSPATRGITLYTRLFCEQIPAPPPGAADSAAGKVFSNEPRQTQREHWEYARANAPECVGCHQQFVPLGLGLEHFDAIGRYRAEEYGKPLDVSIVLDGFDPELDGRYDDALVLAQRTVQSAPGRACFAAQLLTFAEGRTVDRRAESCDLERLGDRLRERDYRIQDLVVELTQLASFYNRRTGE